MTLLESLVAVLVFSIGLLALVGMLALSVATAGEAQYRIEATNHAQSLLQSMRSGVRRSPTGEVDRAHFVLFGHAAASGATPCDFSGAPSGETIVQEWLRRVTDARSGLPGTAGTAWQQVAVDPDRFNEVRVTLCWKQPSESQVHRHEVVGNVN